MSLSELERAFVQLCCEPTLPAPSGDLGAANAKIWGIYRHMVRGRLLEEAKLGLRRTAKAVGDAAFSTMFARFMAEAPPRSRAFYAIVPELAEYATRHWANDATVAAAAPWVLDLVRYEAVRYRVADLPARRDRPVVEFDFDRVPLLHDAAVLCAFEYRVQREPEADGSYVKANTALCVYRSKDERSTGVYVLNAFAADCLRAWQAGATVSQSVRSVCEAQAIQPDAKLIDALCTVLSDLMECGVVLGSQP